MLENETTLTVYREAARFFRDAQGRYVAGANDLLLGLDGVPWPKRLFVTDKGRVVAGGMHRPRQPFKPRRVEYADSGRCAVVVHTDAYDNIG